MRILLIHPEGNINNNPNLIALTGFLSERQDKVDVWSPKESFYQFNPHPGVELFFRSRRIINLSTRVKPFSLYKLLCKLIYRFYYGKKFPNIIIAVDRQAVIDASILSKVFGVPYGMISYEIFFECETSYEFKKMERDSCLNISFCICQDPLRGSHLSRENEIDPKKIVHIPVAGAGIKVNRKNYSLHHSLGLDVSKRIIFYCGTIDKWSLIDVLATSAIQWPEPWVLVIHGRYGVEEHWEDVLAQPIDSKKVYLSKEPADTFEKLSAILAGADFGIAFYKADYKNPWTGKNLEYLGYSSGKIATYLQNGIPVITNEIGELSYQITKYKAGFCVDPASVGDLLSDIDDLALEEMQHNAHKLFSDLLDANNFRDKFLGSLDGSCCNYEICGSGIN